MTKISKIKSYQRLLSLLKLREDTLNNQNLQNNNQAFCDSIKKHASLLTEELIEYLYCYLYSRFAELENATFKINEETRLITIKLFFECPDDNSTKYQQLSIKTITDEVVPIKVAIQEVKTYNDKDFATISNSTVFANSKAIELIKIKSSEEIANLQGKSLEELFQQASTIEKQCTLYRLEKSLNEVNIITATGEMQTIHIDTKGDIFSIEPQIIRLNLEETPQHWSEEKMPAIVRDYLKDLSKKIDIQEEYTSNEPVDEEIRDFVDKLKRNETGDDGYNYNEK